jgi:xyloglucan-specific endo-beta-1,4-glucanase
MNQVAKIPTNFFPPDLVSLPKPLYKLPNLSRKSRSMRPAFSLSAIVAVAGAESPSRVEPRATTMCGQWDSVQTGSYTVYQDLWGMDSGTGEQCSTVNSLSGSSLSWSTSWSWAGGNGQVKSYANVVTDLPVVQLSAVDSLPSIWSWT